MSSVTAITGGGSGRVSSEPHSAVINQFPIFRPAPRSNSLWLWVTRVKSNERAWNANSKSIVLMGSKTAFGAP